MLGWLFGVSCPLSLPWQAYIETTLSWLEQHLPMPPVADPVRPHQLNYNIHDPADQIHLKKRICESMQVDPQTVRVLPDGQEFEGVASDAVLLTPTDQADLTPAQIVSAWAIGCANCMLSNHGLQVEGSQSENDAENAGIRAELAATHCGWGIFIANGGLTAMIQASDAIMNYTIFERKLNHLTAGQAGYALAVIAWRAGMRKADFASDLRDDAGEVFRQGLKYLNAGGDHCYEIEQPKELKQPIELRSAIDLLNDENLPQTLFALQQISAHGEAAKVAFEELTKHLDHHHAEIRLAAIWCSKEIGPPASMALPQLLRELEDSNQEISATAAAAIGTIGGPSEDIRLPLLACLKSVDRAVVYESARAMQQTGVGMYSDTPQVLAALRNSFIGCDFNSAKVLIEILAEICPHSDQVIFKAFEDDPDIREFYLDLIAED